jgi:uncharacterized protein YkwD
MFFGKFVTLQKTLSIRRKKMENLVMRFRTFALLCAVIFGFGVAASAQDKCRGTAIFVSLSCVGDAVSSKEMELFNAVNAYREANGQPPVRLSESLSRLGNRRTLDLVQNMKMLTHSWSNCRYDFKDEATWPCLSGSPARLNSGYNGKGYETIYRTSKNEVDPGLALEAWKKSDLHSSIILNKGMFAAMPWEEFGVAIDGPYATLWFGYRAGATTSVPVAIRSGLGVSLSKAVGQTGISVSPVSRLEYSTIWQGESSDKTIKLEITGAEEDVASVTALSSNSKRADRFFSSLIKNIFPDQPDIESWLRSSLGMLGSNPKGWSKKVVGDRVAELRGEGVNVIRLSIKPNAKPKAIEMD